MWVLWDNFLPFRIVAMDELVMLCQQRVSVHPYHFVKKEDSGKHR